jgi:hypothetical protein
MLNTSAVVCIASKVHSMMINARTASICTQSTSCVLWFASLLDFLLTSSVLLCTKDGIFLSGFQAWISELFWILWDYTKIHGLLTTGLDLLVSSYILTWFCCQVVNSMQQLQRWNFVFCKDLCYRKREPRTCKDRGMMSIITMIMSLQARNFPGLY